MVAGGTLSITSRTWRTIAIGVLCVLSLATTALLYRRQTEDWRGTMKYLIANTRPDDHVLYYDAVGQFAGENYRDWLEPEGAVRPATTGVKPGNSDWVADLNSARRVWLVLYRSQPGDAHTQEIERTLAQRYVRADQRSFTRIIVVEYVAK